MKNLFIVILLVSFASCASKPKIDPIMEHDISEFSETDLIILSWSEGL
jgi:hypothetical protein